MFEEDIKDFILARTENLAQNNINWIEFERLNDIASNNSKLLIKALGKSKDLFFNYENIRSEISLYEQQESYKKGFSDSFNLFLKLYKQI